MSLKILFGKSAYLTENKMFLNRYLKRSIYVIFKDKYFNDL